MAIDFKSWGYLPTPLYPHKEGADLVRGPPPGLVATDTG